MAKIVRDARVLLKRTTTSGEVPVVGIGDDHTTWIGIPSGSSMIYSGEMFVNMTDSRMWTRMSGTTITEHTLFDPSYIPSDSQVMYLVNGHMMGSSSMTFNSGTNSMEVTNINVTNLSGSNTTITNLNVSGPMQMTNIEYGSAPYALFYNNVSSAVTYSSLDLSAGNISYTHPNYPLMATVEDALNQILYISPTGSLSDGTNTFENGQTITSVTLNWSTNKPMVSTVITATGYNSGNLAPAISGSVTNSPISMTSNRTYTITVNDGTNTSTGGFTFSFMNKAYWGVSSNTSLTDPQIIALSNSVLTTTRARVVTVTPSSQYWYYCVPASFGTPTFVIGGVENVPLVTTRTFVNASSYSSSYNIYRSEFLLTGSITITIT